MKNAILIPTYSEHFHFNISFLESVNNFCHVHAIPHIYFITSTADESQQLSTKIDLMQLNGSGNFFVMDVESDFVVYNEFINNSKNDMDSPLYFLGGRSGIVNLKKITGLEKVFSKGYENVVVLDSEVLVFRKSNLLESINEYVDADIYRYSIAAHNHELMAKIQYDSIRSIVRSVDSRSFFSQSYGWYENLCVYNKEKFEGFLTFLSKDNAVSVSKGVAAACNLKGAAFEWISYMAYRVFVLKDELNLSNVDNHVISSVGNIIMNAQNENLYQYITGEDEKDFEFLSAMTPPWIPYTENTRTKTLLERCLPSNCCLMFHVDRKHPGAEEKIDVDVDVDVVEVTNHSNLADRIKNKLKRMFLAA